MLLGVLRRFWVVARALLGICWLFTPRISLILSSVDVARKSMGFKKNSFIV